ncbi:Protein of uncharacterised function (DUF2534) [Leclercia adecarboxylata]|uniref:Protein of uncharacterized function (DUF2534) n=1 Tax=Leclercia adecarboxylata TaxID=83655 RepID=A0A4U9INU9_9ENTR|nr:Protein of uncharacterised function (DUF2534) [Leclercia adecarboxylata]
MLKILKTPEGKKVSYCCGFVCLSLRYAWCQKPHSRGVEDQYNLPMDTWDTSLFIIQGAWVAIYSFMFTIVGALPFGFYFLGPKDDSE